MLAFPEFCFNIQFPYNSNPVTAVTNLELLFKRIHMGPSYGPLASSNDI